MIADHESGVEAYTELTNDVDVFLGFVILFESQRTTAGDGAQVVFQILLGHADTIIRNGEGAGFLVHRQPDLKILPVHADTLIGQRTVIELINGITGIGNQLTEKNLPMGIDGIDHQVKQTFGFRLEFFFCHNDRLPFLVSWANGRIVHF